MTQITQQQALEALERAIDITIVTSGAFGNELTHEVREQAWKDTQVLQAIRNGIAYGPASFMYEDDNEILRSATSGAGLPESAVALYASNIKPENGS